MLLKLVDSVGIVEKFENFNWLIAYCTYATFHCLTKYNQSLKSFHGRFIIDGWTTKTIIKEQGSNKWNASTLTECSNTNSNKFFNPFIDRQTYSVIVIQYLTGCFGLKACQKEKKKESSKRFNSVDPWFPLPILYIVVARKET